MTARALIDPQALRANLATVRRTAPASKVMAVIKADAYGHGAVNAARALDDADAFAVARIAEARVLREAGIDRRLLLLSGVHAAAEVTDAAVLRLDLCVQHEWQIEALRAAPDGARFDTWLKVDTGMHRLGFPSIDPATVRDAWDALRALPCVGELRLMTHLACADVPTDPATANQLARFAAISTALGAGERSIANSAGLFAHPDARVEWVRPGICLYGASPFPGGRGADLGLRPVMDFETRLVATRRVPAGDRIGYGGRWTAQAPMQIGIAAAGYADGYTRHLRPGAPVLVGGRRCEVVGRVSMDLAAISLRAAPRAAVGEHVLMWGGALPVDEVARAADTIPYSLLTGVTARVPRSWRNG